MKKHLSSAALIALCYISGLAGANTPPVLSGLGKIIFSSSSPAPTISDNAGELDFNAGGTNKGFLFTPTGTGFGIGLGSAPISATSGRLYLTVKGSTSAGVLETATGQADADLALIGMIQGTDVNGLDAEKRAGLIQILSSGPTANHRGGQIRFLTKADSGSASVWWTLDRQGFGGFGGNTAPGFAVDATGDVNASSTFKQAGTTVVDASRNVIAGAGANTVLRCATGGTLPAGTLTTTGSGCGTTADTGFRAK